MPTIREILVPVDFSDTSERAFRVGLLLAEPSGATIHLMHDIEVPTETITGATIVREEMDREYAESERKMAELASIPEAGQAKVSVEILRSTDPKRSILAYVDEHDIDLVVLGTHGRTRAVDKVLGSTAERVLRRNPRPTVTVPPEASVDRIRRIVVPVDFSEHSARAVTNAVDLARAHGARLSLVHAKAEDSVDQVKEKLRRLHADAGGDAADVDFVMSSDDIAETVLGAVRETEADLVVMATHGRTGLRRMLTRNIAESIIHNASCPVMTYRMDAE